MEDGETESVLIKEEKPEEDRDPQGERRVSRQERVGQPGGVCSSAPEKALLATLTAEERSGSRLSSLEALSGGHDTAAVDSALGILGGMTSSVWSSDITSGALHAQGRHYGERGQRAPTLCVPHPRTGPRQSAASAAAALDPPGTKWPPSSSDKSLAGSQRWRAAESVRFLCKYCGKGFRFAAKLQVHHRVHTGEKPYRCTHCGRSFSQSCSLTRHLNVHTGYKPFSCAQCGKGYTNKRSLKKHQAAHRAERFGM